MNEVFKYGTVMTYVDPKGNLTEIPMDNINFFVIDKDYETNTIPVITMGLMIDRKLRDKMIQFMDESTISFRVTKYNTFDNDKIGQDTLSDIFFYLIEGDVSYSEEIDYKDNINPDNEVLTKTTIYLMKRDSVNNNRKIFNFVARSRYVNGKRTPLTMTDLVMVAANTVRPMLLEPLDTDPEFEEVVIPPLSSVTEYLEYLNDNLSTLYPTGYRYFCDFDTTYLISKSGKKIEHKDQRFNTIIINIGNLLNFENAEDGSYYDPQNRLYHVPVGVSNTKFTKNIVTKHLVTNVCVIDSTGALSEKSLGNTNKNNTAKSKIFVNSTSNSGLVNNVSNRLINDELVVDIMKNDLDASIFTINKEYIIKNTLAHEEYDGRYLLCSNKQVYVKQDDIFLLSTALRFKKISQ